MMKMRWMKVEKTFFFSPGNKTSAVTSTAIFQVGFDRSWCADLCDLQRLRFFFLSLKMLKWFRWQMNEGEAGFSANSQQLSRLTGSYGEEEEAATGSPAAPPASTHPSQIMTQVSNFDRLTSLRSSIDAGFMFQFRSTDWTLPSSRTIAAWSLPSEKKSRQFWGGGRRGGWVAGWGGGRGAAVTLCLSWDAKTKYEPGDTIVLRASAFFRRVAVKLHEFTAFNQSMA